MKILSFSSCFPSRARPTEGIFVFDRLAALAEKVGVRVVHPLASCPILGPLNGHRAISAVETIGPVRVHHCRFTYLPGLLKRLDGWLYGRGLGRWVARECRREPADLLDAHFAWPDAVGVSLLARRLRLPYTVTLRGTINPRYKRRCFRHRIARALRGAAAVISVSRPMADIAWSLGVEASRVHVIPNGVDTQTFRPIDRSTARRRLGLRPEQRLVACIASLKAPKGQADLLRALSEKAVDAQIWLVGAPADRPGYLRRLRALASTPQLQGRVRFTGSLSRPDVVTCLNAADLTVLPSHSEGCPNVVLESLACGTPVVATDVGATSQLILPGRTGLLVPPRRPNALVRAIQKTLQHPWSREDIRRSVAGRSWRAVARRTLDVFQTALLRT